MSLANGGDAGLVSRQRGCPSHNQLPRDIRERVRVLLKDKYADFGPKLASEKLLELDGITVSRETIRRIQMDTGLWKPKKRRARRVFQPRDRRPRFGELIQIDGSPHDWLEGRGPRCTLIVFIDDATGRLTALRSCQRRRHRQGVNITLARARVVAGHARERYPPPARCPYDPEGTFRTLR